MGVARKVQDLLYRAGGQAAGGYVFLFWLGVRV